MFSYPITYRRHLNFRDLKMWKDDVLELVKYWRPQNEQDGEMHDRGRGENKVL